MTNYTCPDVSKGLEVIRLRFSLNLCLSYHELTFQIFENIVAEIKIREVKGVLAIQKQQNPWKNTRRWYFSDKKKNWNTKERVGMSGVLHIATLNICNHESFIIKMSENMFVFCSLCYIGSKIYFLSPFLMQTIYLRFAKF